MLKKFLVGPHSATVPLGSQPGNAVPSRACQQAITKRLFMCVIASAALLPAQTSFTRDVAPILGRNCVSCHSASQQMSELDLSTRAAALKGGQKSGPAIVPGDSSKSPIYRRLTGDDQPRE